MQIREGQAGASAKAQSQAQARVRRVILVNHAEEKSPFAALKPTGVPVFGELEFAALAAGAESHRLLAANLAQRRKGALVHAQQSRGLSVEAAAAYGESCDDVCRVAGKQCAEEEFVNVDSCGEMQQHFGCERGCQKNTGLEQPAYVNPAAPADAMPGTCLLTTDPAASTCSARHQLTRRLCPCVPYV